MATITQSRSQDSGAKWQEMFNKVPEITLYFWIIKILCTTVGETFADFLDINLNIGLTGTSILMGVLLALALFFQFKTKKYVPWVYWLTVALISVFGTLVTDNLTDSIGVPLEASTIIFSVLLGLTFVWWYVSEKTLSIHSIFTKRREMFYWLTILFTFALGTAAGDLMAEGLGLGYLVTGIIVALVITTIVGARKFGLNSVLSFWLIYILTRPLGASIGDYLSQPAKYGGLGLGATGTSVLFIGAILALVIFLSVTKRDVIGDDVVKEEITVDEKGGIWQTVITILLFIVIGGSAYAWQHNKLQTEIENTNSDTDTVAGNIQAPAVVATSSVKTNDTGSNTKPVIAPVSPKPVAQSTLGDLSSFRKITEDTRALVVAGDLAGAKNRIADLEYEWDQAEAKLKAKDSNKWYQVDDAIDAALRQLRAINPNAGGCKTSLDVLLGTLK